jgi:hypothetical protein
MSKTPPPLKLQSEMTQTNALRWRLPSRPWGSGWFMPLLLMIIGVVVLGFVVYNAPYKLPNIKGGVLDFVGDLFDLIGPILGTAIGSTLLFIGFVLRRATTTVTLDSNEITSTDHLGPLRWTRRIQTSQIIGFEISVGTVSTNGGPAKPTNNVTLLLANKAPADAKPKSKKKFNAFIIAWAYPKTWMQQLVDELTASAKRIAPRLAELEITTTIEHEHTFNGQPEKAVDQPEETRILITRQPDGLTFDIPPTGWLRGTKGLGCFTILWNGFILVFLVVVISSITKPGSVGNANQFDPWMLLFLSPFVAIGIGMALFTTHLGKSRSRLVVVGTGPESVVAFNRISPVRKPRELTWATSELTHIRMGDSNMSVNDEPVQELQINPKEGKQVGLLAQLDDEELKWIAYELRRQTGLPRYAVEASDEI